MVGQMTRSTEQALADQATQAAAERKQRAAHAVKPPPGLSPLHALQERLWGWHDMRQGSNDKYARQRPGSDRSAAKHPR